MRIVVLGIDAGANSYYRGLYPARALADRGHAVRYHGVTDLDMRLDALRGFDVALVYRHCTRAAHRVAAGLRDAGVAVVYDNDDMVGSVTSDHPNRRDFGGLSGVALHQRVQQMLRVAHVVTTPSPALAAQYRETADRVRVIENYVPDAFAAVPRRSHAGLVVGWVAGAEHRIDRDRLRLRDTLGELLAAHPQLRVVTIGIGLGLASDRCENIPHVPFPELGAALAGFDIGIAPLADVPINRARSTSKLKEYAAVGVPWLASPIGPYRDLGEKEGGRLVPDDGWHAAIERLVTRDRERRKLAKRAARWGRDQAIGKHAGAWEAVLEEAIDRARSAS